MLVRLVVLLLAVLIAVAHANAEIFPTQAALHTFTATAAEGAGVRVDVGERERAHFL